MSKKLSEQEKARRAWVRALRSGKYGWGKGQLNPSEGKFCCLGVLCEVAIRRGIIDSYPEGEGFPPPKVRSWVGLKDCAGMFDQRYKNKTSLVGLNDEARRNPFKMIADLLEKNDLGILTEEK